MFSSSTTFFFFLECFLFVLGFVVVVYVCFFKERDVTMTTEIPSLAGVRYPSLERIL